MNVKSRVHESKSMSSGRSIIFYVFCCCYFYLCSFFSFLFLGDCKIFPNLHVDNLNWALCLFFVLGSVRFVLFVKSKTHLFTPSHNSIGHIVLIGLF